MNGKTQVLIPVEMDIELMTPTSLGVEVEMSVEIDVTISCEPV